jgi:hypothetical protein
MSGNGNDFLEKALQVGDEVVFVPPGYRKFAKGKVLRFTPQFVIIEYFNTWNYGGPVGHRCELKQTTDQLIKVE